MALQEQSAYRHDPHICEKKIAFRIVWKEGHLLRNPGAYYTISATKSAIFFYTLVWISFATITLICIEKKSLKLLVGGQCILASAL